MALQSPSPVIAPAHILALLDHLHELSTTQERTIDMAAIPAADFDNIMRDKFIALDKDKCCFLYQLARAIGAKNVVEAGTSFGVSTIYLALAVGSNVGGVVGRGRVIATEKEGEKAERARGYWGEAGGLVTGFVELREGDLLESLRGDVGEVDLLLLDIWAPLALPTLKLVLPRLRSGAVVVVDNTISSANRYQELLTFLRAPGSLFTNLTLPYANGLEMCVYLPSGSALGSLSM